MSIALCPAIFLGFLLLIGLNRIFSIINSKSTIDNGLVAFVELAFGFLIFMIIVTSWTSIIKNEPYSETIVDDITIYSGLLTLGILIIAHLLVFNIKKYYQKKYIDYNFILILFIQSNLPIATPPYRIPAIHCSLRTSNEEFNEL